MIEIFKKMFLAVAVMAMTVTAPAMTYSGEQTKDPVVVKRYIVKEDGGGVVDEFKAALAYMQKEKMAVKLDGRCASACTLLLAQNFKMDVCITSKAVFMFHQPFSAYRTITGPVIDYSIPSVSGSERLWKEEFYGKYYDWVKKLIDGNGGVPSVYTGSTPQDTFNVGYDILKEHMKVCA
jgi:hypothetical protein